MIHSIQIQGYRGFERFEMSGLGRVNLLVGTNNSGKTSVLEGIYLLMSRSDPSALWQLLWRRGERLTVPAGTPERPQRRQQTQLDICHLFTGHELQPGSRFSISAKNQTPESSITFSVVELSTKDRKELFGSDDDGLQSRFALHVKGNPQPAVTLVPLSRNGGIVSDALEAPSRFRRRQDEMPTSVFITTESLVVDELIWLWGKVVLTPAEGLVLRALQFIDRDIERIAALPSSQSYYGPASRGGFMVKRRGFELPIPIGSMGDGMWRMLAMAVAITQCKNGFLLVDEIDTGLHHSVMSSMWQLIFNAAKEFNVQVFATTHSYDCVYSLAHVCADADADNPVTVQRIEPGKSNAIPFNQDEIKVAADREIEVR